MGGTISGLVVPGSIRKQVDQAMKNKPISSFFPPWTPTEKEPPRFKSQTRPESRSRSSYRLRFWTSPKPNGL